MGDLLRLTSLQLAAAASCDPRTTNAWLRGRRVRGLTAERIERAARELGIRRPEATLPQSPPEGATP
jgi:hypothetical protein